MSRAVRRTLASMGMMAAMLLVTALTPLAVAQDATPEGAATPVTLWPPQDLLPPPTLTAEGRTATLDGIDIYFEIYGEGNGDPVILLHDGLSHGGHFVNQIPALARNHQVIVMDSRGHGRSTFNATPLSYEVMMSDVLALLDHLEIEQTSIVGVGDGGVLALKIALAHPERVNRAVIAGARFNPDGMRADMGDSPYVGAYIARAAEEYKAQSSSPKRWDDFLTTLMTLWATEPTIPEARLQQITSPFLILAGADEEVIAPEHTQRLADLIPDAELVLMPGTGHFAMFEQPEEFTGLIVDFLDG